MKNNFLTIGRAKFNADADTETLLIRLRRYPEVTLAHLFLHEPVILLFIATHNLQAFNDFQQRLAAENGIANCQYCYLSHTISTCLVSTYEPPTWLL